VAGGRRPRAEREKKVRRAAEQDRPDVAARRQPWRADQPALDPDRLVFVDETWASTNMARTYGRAPVGERLVGPVPHGHWKTTTFIAALRAGGLTAPRVIDGAVTGDLFVAYVRQVLVPTLRPGDVVVRDNLACHQRAEVRAAIEAAGGQVRYLPPYRPDLNPIELAFAKLKALLRKAGKRTVEELWTFLGEALDAFAPAECRNYFRHSGYQAAATPTPKTL
jgi:transposase